MLPATWGACLQVEVPRFVRSLHRPRPHLWAGLYPILHCFSKDALELTWRAIVHSRKNQVIAHDTLARSTCREFEVRSGQRSCSSQWRSIGGIILRRARLAIRPE